MTPTNTTNNHHTTAKHYRYHITTTTLPSLLPYLHYYHTTKSTMKLQYCPIQSIVSFGGVW
ncbi:unnamed protein product, partial [Nesidiocoris tenuis]